MIESKMLLTRPIAIFTTRITIRILASRNSAPDNLEPNTCFGKQLSVRPQTSAADASTRNSVMNIPFSAASPSRSFFWFSRAKKRR